MTTIVVERLGQDKAGTWVWVPETIELDVEGDFSIEELELNQEICRMGKLLVKYGELAADLGAELKRKEEYIKLVRAQVGAAIRSKAEADGTKLTEGKLADEVILHNAYQAALAQLHILRASAIKVDSFWRSASKKADLLNALAFRQNAEIRKAGY
jgi:hypothetical protein